MNSPQANGLAESGVNIVKNLLLKCMNERGDMQRVLYEWRNMPKSCLLTHRLQAGGSGKRSAVSKSG